MSLFGWFKKRSLTAKYMILSVAVLCIGFSLVGSLLIVFLYPFETVSQFLIGLSTASFVSILRLVLMDKSITKSTSMDEKKAKTHAQFHFFIRYFLVLIYAVLVVMLKKYVGVFGAILGLFDMQLSAYIANYFLNKRDNKKNS